MLKVFFPELALGIKTIFFTIIGPLINPAGAPHHLMGVYQPHLVDLVGEAVAQLDMKHVIVAHGVDGLDEISILGPTKIAEIKGTRVERYEIAPEDFGFKRATFDDIKGGDPAFNARRDPRHLRGPRPGPAARLPRARTTRSRSTWPAPPRARRRASRRRRRPSTPGRRAPRSWRSSRGLARDRGDV